MLSKQLRLDVAQLTDVGRKRSHNEDNMAYVTPQDVQVVAKKGSLFIVADGMGGHAAGEIASEIAVETIRNAYYQDDNEDAATSLLHAIKRANTLIHQRSAENMLRSGMGTTCVATVIRGNVAYIANVGDSRAYIVRGGQIKQVSQDHSWVAEQVRAGLLTEDQARSHAQRNVITRCLGTQMDVEVDVFAEVVEEHDTIVLCTDGLSGLVNDAELCTIVEQYAPQESVYHLVERANEQGGPDNITAIVVRVLEAGEESSTTRHPVRVGGRQSIEDATTLAVLPSASLEGSTQPKEGGITSTPLRLSSGPLSLANAITAPQPILQRLQHKHGRLFYPTIAIIGLLLVSLVGVNAYLFHLFMPAVDVNHALTQAHTLLIQAQDETATDPIAALQQLSDAQVQLRAVQGAALSETQRTQFTALQHDLVSTVQAALSAYNHQYLITPLSCPTTAANTLLTTVRAPLQASGLATAQDEKHTVFSYALGADHLLYQVSAHNTLASPFALSGNLQMLTVASDGSRLLALAQSSTPPVQYSLTVLAPQAPTGSLKPVNTSLLDTTLTKNGQVPTFLTAWDRDVYVVLSNQATPDTALILDYVLDAQKGAVSPTPVRSSTISITTPLVGEAAFPGGQLFLLQSGGTLQSLHMTGGSQTVTKQVAANVLLTSALATPLPVGPAQFRAEMTVPAVTRPIPGIVNLPSAAETMTLVAGQVNAMPHLYILDGTNHRILDMQVASATGTATPPASTEAEPSVKMQLVRQYAWMQGLSQVRSIVVDPSHPELDALVQKEDSDGQQAIVKVNVTPNNQNGCV